MPTCPRYNVAGSRLLPTLRRQWTGWQARSQRPARSLSSRDRRRTWVGGIQPLSSSAPGNAFGSAMLLPEIRPDSGGPRVISGSSPQLGFWPCSPRVGWRCVSPVGFRSAGRTGGAKASDITSLDLSETAPVRSHLSEIDLRPVTLGRMREAAAQTLEERETIASGNLRARATGADLGRELARPW